MENLSKSGVAPQYIPLHLIEEFTNHFSEDRKIGNGTYGDVYKGTYNGEEVAVKMLRFMPEKDDQKQFRREFENIARLRHENIVRLIAYSYEAKYKYVDICTAVTDISDSATVKKEDISDNALDHRKKEKEKESKITQVLAAEIHRALCFEYMQNGSVQKHLYDEFDGLDWPTRYKIIKGTCEALEYLHEGIQPPVLHLDLKPENILLDNNMFPKLADFGLSKLFIDEQTRSLQRAEQTISQMSGAVGTMGYTPPEYIDKNEVSKKFDIFSLGVIIIKVMTGGEGRSKYHEMSSRDSFIDQVHKNWRERLKETAAYTALDEECHQVKTCIKIALDCVEHDPNKRPSIGSVVRSLKETEDKIDKLVISLPHNEQINDPWPHANKMPAPKALVQVEPQQLCYRYPIELKKKLTSSLQLKNMTNDHVAYMFAVSGEVEYSSARAKGIISPRSTWEVVLNMKAHNASVPQQESKVILQSTIVSKNLSPSDITLEMFKQTDRIVDEVKLVVMEASAPSQSPIQKKVGKQQSHQEVTDDAFKMLDVRPHELRFHFERNKLVPCSLTLTNTRDKEHVAFRLIEKSGESAGCFVQLPLQGTLPPQSTQTLIVTTKKLEEQPRKRDYDLILQTCVLAQIDTLFHRLPFEDQYECEEFFTRVKDRGGLVHEVAMKASQEKSSEILSMETTRDIFYCLDTNPVKKWIITGYCSGYVHIWNYETQMAVNSLKVSNTAVCAVKFIARKRCFVAGSFDGFLHVYDCGTKLSYKKKSWKACGGSITSLAIHPLKPYVLSSADGDSIKLWNWEEGWKCTQIFKYHVPVQKTIKYHSYSVCQLVFNPRDTNVFASASNDKTVKVWRLDSSYPEYTLEGHSKEVTCLDFFSSGDHQCLISGSNDRTAKIWDLQKKMCIQTLDTFFSSVTCASAHPNLPVLISGSEDGILHLWSSTNFRLERVLNIASGGDVRGIGCLMGSRRVVIGQSSALIELSIDTMNYHEAYMPCDEQYLSGDESREETAPGDTASEESYVPSGDLLQVHPLQLHFPMGLNKLTPCPVHLTNYTNDGVAFKLNRRKWRGDSLNLPQAGVMPPRSTCTLVITAEKMNKPPKRRDIDLILESRVVTEKNAEEMNKPPERRDIDLILESRVVTEKNVHEVTLKAVYVSHGELSSEDTYDERRFWPCDIESTNFGSWTQQDVGFSLQVLSVETITDFYSFDSNEMKQWIIRGASGGYVHIRNYHKQKPVDSVKVSTRGVFATKFISQKQWFLAASSDGFICVYNYLTKKLVTRFKASVGSIKSLVVHPFKPYVLSWAEGEPIKLWNWEECREGRWECAHTFEGHTSVINQITFNPLDTNTFASASTDGTVKVWNLASRYHDYTFRGHSDKVNCADYFTRGDQPFLISGSDDCTAKIWDLKEKKCVQTLEAYLSPVTSICSHPKLPVLVTGSSDGFVTLWSSADFRFQRIISIAGYGGVRGFGCLMGSRSILIGQDQAVSILTVDDMELKEAASMAFSEQEISAGVSPGGTTSGEKKSASTELLDIEPREHHFPYGLGRITVRSLKLTNKTDKQVAFRLTEKSGFVDLTLFGTVPPRSTYTTLVVPSKKLDEAPRECYMDLILHSSALEYQNIYPFEKDSEYCRFFSDVKELGKTVHEVTIKAVYVYQQGKTTSEMFVLDEIIPMEPSLSSSFDTNELKKWIIIGHIDGYISIWNYKTQKPMDLVKVSTGAVCSTKFVSRKQWFLAASSDGFISVYNYNTKMVIIRFKASESFITSMAVHPTEPYVLSSAEGEPIKLWNWEECREGRWECAQTFEGHTSEVNQITFNPFDTNTFASASTDGSIKVWNLASRYLDYTFLGHSNKVNCVDYFNHGGQPFLISGSDDRTTKIWDLQEKKCVQTLEASLSRVTSVCSHPMLPVLVTGSSHEYVTLWSSTDFRFQRIISIAGYGDILGFGCLMGSKSILIAQVKAVSVLTMDDDMELEEAASVEFNEQEISAGVSPGATTSGERKSTTRELLDIEPRELHFPYGLGKLTARSLKLTNKTDEQVAFRLMEKSGGFLKLPLCGVVLPRSTYTLVVTTEKLEEASRERYMDMILQSSALGYQTIYPFIKYSEYHRFFSDAGKAVHEVTIKAAYGDQQGKATSEGTTSGFKIFYVEDLYPEGLWSVDVNPTDPWIVTGDCSGCIRILDSDTQGLVDSMVHAMGTSAMCVKIITRKKWIVAGSSDGSIYVYSYENNKMKNIERINAATNWITSLAVHPTQPLVLSTSWGSPIKLWNWDKQWECTKEFYDEHSDDVHQVVFNPVDTDSFTCASRDRTVKVWNLDTPSSVCTFEGHSDEVNCLDYFACDSKQYLISGSDDGTAKIWDLETKMCVQTLDAFVGAVTSVCSHPSLPLLITGSWDGVIQFWSSTTFRLENVLKIGCPTSWYNTVDGIGFFKDSRRIVIGQRKTLSVIEVVDGEPVASNNQDDNDEESVASKDQLDYDKEPVASKDQVQRNI